MSRAWTKTGSSRSPIGCLGSRKSAARWCRTSGSRQRCARFWPRTSRAWPWSACRTHAWRAAGRVAPAAVAVCRSVVGKDQRFGVAQIVGASAGLVLRGAGAAVPWKRQARSATDQADGLGIDAHRVRPIGRAQAAIQPALLTACHEPRAGGSRAVGIGTTTSAVAATSTARSARPCSGSFSLPRNCADSSGSALRRCGARDGALAPSAPDKTRTPCS